MTKFASDWSIRPFVVGITALPDAAAMHSAFPMRTVSNAKIGSTNVSKNSTKSFQSL
ncbi:MAG: hypothetical protein NTY42_03425 [Planctomycetota bacterium]|nr:hypothetical protein [Planctomycetota bacterium]